MHQSQVLGAVRLILQEAVHYLHLGRLNMWWNALILPNLRGCLCLCFSSTNSSRWPKETMILSMISIASYPNCNWISNSRISQGCQPSTESGKQETTMMGVMGHSRSQRMQVDLLKTTYPLMQ